MVRRKNRLAVDARREIRNTFSRYLSILVLSALAVAFLAGLRATAPNMQHSADRYYDETNMMDGYVLSTLGITDEDLEALANADGIAGVEGGRSLDAIASECIVTVASLPQSINLLKVTEGRLPRTADECVAEGLLLLELDLDVGDTLEVTLPEGEDGLKRTSFTIVGKVTSPLYVSPDRGSSRLGSGAVDGLVYVFGENFDMEVWTVAYFTGEGLLELESYGDDYEDRAETLLDSLEALAEQRAELRYQSVVGEAQDKLAEARQELEEVRAEVNQELADAEAELADARKQLDDGWTDYYDGLETLDRELADAAAELDDARQKLDDGWADYYEGVETLESELADAAEELADARKQLDDGWNEYYDGVETLKSELADAEAELADARKQLDDGWAEYHEGAETLKSELANAEAELADAREQLDDGWVEYHNGLETLETELAAARQKLAEAKTALEQAEADYQAALTQYQEGLAQYESNLALLDAQQAQVSDGYAQYEAALAPYVGTPYYDMAVAQAAPQKAQLDAAQAQLTEGYAQLAAGKAQLDEAKIQLEEGAAALASGNADYEAGLAELNTQERDGRQALAGALAELEAGETDYAAGLAEFETSKVNAEAELADARSELEGAETDYADGVAEYERIKAEAEAELSEALQELETGEAEYADGVAEYERSKAEAEAELADALEELEHGETEYADGLVEYADSKAEAEEELADALVELEEGEADYADGLVDYEEGKAEAETELAEAEAELADAQAEVDDIEECEWFVLGRNANAGFVGYAQDSERVGNLAKVFPVIFFLVAALACLTTMTRMVEEQRTQIGTLKAMGFSRFAISKKYIGYALSASLIGGVLGLGLGVTMIPAVIFNAFNIMYAIPKLYFKLQLGMYLIAVLAAVVCTTGAGLWACMSTLMDTPANLMRPKAPKAGRRVLLERVTVIWSKLSFTWKVTMRNLFRYQKRFWMTVIGIGGCTALIVTGFGLHDSIFSILNRQFDDISIYDASVTLDADLSAEQWTEIEQYLELDGQVEDYLPCRQTAVDASAGSVAYSATLFAVADQDAFARFIDLRHRLDDNPVVLRDGGVVITEKLSELLDVEIGDTVVLEGDERVEAEVIDIAENYVMHYIYLTADTYTELFAEEEKDNSVLLDYQDGEVQAISDRVSAELMAMDGVTAYTYIATIRDSFMDSMSAIDYAVIIIILAAAALAFVVLYNLTNINITERTRELATLKVLGFHDKETSAYVYRENIFLTIFGIALGLVGGRFLHSWMVLTVEVDLVMFGRTSPPYAYILAAVLTVVFSVLVNVAAHFKLKKVDMVESLKSVE